MDGSSHPFLLEVHVEVCLQIVRQFCIFIVPKDKFLKVDFVVLTLDVRFYRCLQISHWFLACNAVQGATTDVQTSVWELLQSLS